MAVPILPQDLIRLRDKRGIIKTNPPPKVQRVLVDLGLKQQTDYRDGRNGVRGLVTSPLGRSRNLLPISAASMVGDLFSTLEAGVLSCLPLTQTNYTPSMLM